MSGAVPLRVRVSLSLPIDVEAWALNYGVEGGTAIRADVIAYVANLVREQLRDVGVLADDA